MADRIPITTPTSLPLDYLNFAQQSLDEIDPLIYQMGIRVLHTHSVVCPCISINAYGGTQQAKPNCSACNGLGIAFVEEQTSEMRALVSELDSMPKDTEGGNVTLGNIRITFPCGYIVSEGDRIILSDVFVPINWTVQYKKSVGGIVLPFEIHSVEVMTTIYNKPESELIVLKPIQDYTVNLDKRLVVFPDGSKVTDRMIVSGSFIARPFYIIESIAKANRQIMAGLTDSEGTLRLPLFVTATRADILLTQQKKEISGYGSATLYNGEDDLCHV